MTYDLRLGRWQDVLADVTTCDAVICDPPYSARTHEASTDETLNGSGRIHGRAYEAKKKGSARAPGHPRAGGPGWEERWAANGGERRALNYTAWTPDDVAEFVAAWAPRCKGWMACFTSHDLAPAYQAAYEAAGLYAFAPLPWFSPGSRVRLSGDGPSNWTCWLMVARPSTRELQRWGTLPGGYQTVPERCAVVGGKPLGLMQAIIRDYTRPGDLVVDPFAGAGTTALACITQGRRCITSEAMPAHYEIARRRLAKGHTVDMFSGRME